MSFVVDKCYACLHGIYTLCGYVYCYLQIVDC